MMNDPHLLQLWGRIASSCQVECGAMYMVESVEESMKDNVSILACCNSTNETTMRLIAGDYQGNVCFYNAEYALINSVKPHKYYMKRKERSFVGTWSRLCRM